MSTHLNPLDLISRWAIMNGAKALLLNLNNLRARLPKPKRRLRIGHNPDTTSMHRHVSGLLLEKPLSPMKLRDAFLVHSFAEAGATNIDKHPCIVSASYFKSQASELIRFDILENTGIIRGTLLLEPIEEGVDSKEKSAPPSIHSGILSVMKSMAPSGTYFDCFRDVSTESARLYTEVQFSGLPGETITYDPPLPIENIIVLAVLISSRRFCEAPKSHEKYWLVQTMWEGLRRLKASQSDPPRETTGEYVRVGPIFKLTPMNGVFENYESELESYRKQITAPQHVSSEINTIVQPTNSNYYTYLKLINLTGAPPQKDDIQEEIDQRKREIAEKLKRSKQLEQERERLALETKRIEEILRGLNRSDVASV